MKKILVLISSFFLIFSCADLFKTKTPEPKASPDFVQGSEDIPLLAGMEKISDDDTIGFDSSSGSIISSSYTTDLNKRQIRNFYIQTLPQLGWEVIKNLENNLSFKRENENLEIEFTDENDKKMVKFFISSAL